MTKERAAILAGCERNSVVREFLAEIRERKEDVVAAMAMEQDNSHLAEFKGKIAFAFEILGIPDEVREEIGGKRK